MSDVRFWAKRYLDEGFGRPHPMPQGAKFPTAKGWNDPETSFGIEAFGAEDNIGTMLTGNLVDIDLDHPVAVALAPMFLPPTGRVHGRPGKPASHYWYRIDDCKYYAFNDIPHEEDDPDKPGEKRKVADRILEIRTGVGKQTALPPSLHPAQERYAWEPNKEGAPGQPSKPDTWDAVRALCASSVLAINWPKGNRHLVASTMAGFLAARNRPVEECLRIIEGAARYNRDEEVEDRLRVVRDTYKTFAAGGKTTGGPTMQTALGQEVVNRLTELYGGNESIHDQLVADMNTTRFMTTLGKDTVYGHELEKEVLFQKKEAVAEWFVNDKIVIGEKKVGADKGGKITKTRFEIWREHPLKRVHRQVVFTPPPLIASPEDYNLWHGFAVQPLMPPPGDPAREHRAALAEWAKRECAPKCSMFLDLVHNVICSGNQAHSIYLMKWLAFLMQFPGLPAEVAVVLKGDLGTGKGSFSRTLGSILGRHFAHLDKRDHMTGRFNASMSGKILVFADEAFFAGDRKDLGSLKRIITEPTLAIERKGIDSSEEANHVHLIMATNEEWVHQAAPKERRYFTTLMSNLHAQDRTYFGAFHEQMNSGGREALLSYLMTLPVTHDDIRAVPLTKELRGQQEESLTPDMQWWFGCLVKGTIGTMGWPEAINLTEVHAIYLRWCDEQNIGRRRTDVDMGRRILAPWLEPRKKIQGSWLRPLKSLYECRKTFDALYGTEGDWESEGNDPTSGNSPATKEDLPF